MFLPDSKHHDNRDGEKFLALLQVSAAEYNQISQDMEDAISKLQTYHDVSVFSASVLNPTQITEASKMI